MDELSPEQPPLPPEPAVPEPSLNQPLSPEVEPPAVFYSPNSDERTFATLAHALMMVGWWIAPLIIFLVKRESRFVRFHALQALLLQIFYSALFLTIMVIFIAVAVGSSVGMTAHPTEPPAALMVFFPLLWLGGMGIWIVMLLVTIFYSIKAGKGEWANYPLLGPLARYMLGIPG
jgi:uncharacterized protein